jgi:hypothetical protein
MLISSSWFIAIRSKSKQKFSNQKKEGILNLKIITTQIQRFSLSDIAVALVYIAIVLIVVCNGMVSVHT